MDAGPRIAPQELARMNSPRLQSQGLAAPAPQVTRLPPPTQIQRQHMAPRGVQEPEFLPGQPVYRGPTTSDEILDMTRSIIKRDEGTKKSEDGQHVAYPDNHGGSNTWAIGHGHQVKAADLRKLGIDVDQYDGDVDAALRENKLKITDEQAEALFEEDLNGALKDTVRLLEQADIDAYQLSPHQFSGLVQMVFQMGAPSVSRFKNMLRALRRGDNQTAMAEALDSRWAKQTPARARRVAQMIGTGYA